MRSFIYYVLCVVQSVTRCLWECLSPSLADLHVEASSLLCWVHSLSSGLTCETTLLREFTTEASLPALSLSLPPSLSHPPTHPHTHFSSPLRLVCLLSLSLSPSLSHPPTHPHTHTLQFTTEASLLSLSLSPSLSHPPTHPPTHTHTSVHH